MYTTPLSRKELLFPFLFLIIVGKVALTQVSDAELRTHLCVARFPTALLLEIQPQRGPEQSREIASAHFGFPGDYVPRHLAESGGDGALHVPGGG